MAVGQDEEEIVDERTEKLDDIFKVRDGAETKTNSWMLELGCFTSYDLPSRHPRFLYPEGI